MANSAPALRGSPHAGHLARAIGCRAVGTAASLGPALLAKGLGAAHLAEITLKVESVATNEITPLVSSAAMHKGQRNALIQVVGDALGVCYLGDYALEQGIAFDIDAACEMGHRIAGHGNMAASAACRIIEELAAFYVSESALAASRAVARDLLARYCLKSRDVLFVQVLAVSAIGVSITAEDAEALSHACTALEVLDDFTDIGEDSRQRSPNPFRDAHTPQERQRLFSTLEAACLPRVRWSAGSARVGPFIREYSRSVEERIRLHLLTR